MTIDCEKREKRTVGIAKPTCRVTRWPAAGAAECRAEARMRPCAEVARRPASASSVVRSSAIAIEAIMRDPSSGEEFAPSTRPASAGRGRRSLTPAPLLPGEREESLANYREKLMRALLDRGRTAGQNAIAPRREQ